MRTIVFTKEIQKIDKLHNYTTGFKFSELSIFLSLLVWIVLKPDVYEENNTHMRLTHNI